MISKFISDKLKKELGSGNKFSKPIINIAIVSITISIMVMLISISVVKGFQGEIKNKIINFAAHIQITDGGTNFTGETSPILLNQKFYPSIKNKKGFKHIQTYVTKAGIIQSKPDTVKKSEDEIKINRDIEGVIFKGVNDDFDWEFIDKKLVAGKSFRINKKTTNDSILISNKLAKKLKLSVNDKVASYFPNKKSITTKRFIIAGIYETGFEEFDDKFIFTDIKVTQKLNNWGISSSLFLEENRIGDKVTVSAFASGGNGNYRYKWGENDYSNFSKISFEATKDTTIRVIITDFDSYSATLEPVELSISDTAFLTLKVEKTELSEEIKFDYTPIEFDYKSINDSTREYTADGIKITTILSTTGGSMKYYVGAFEIFITDFSELDTLTDYMDRHSDPFLSVTNIQEVYWPIFNWLKVLDTNTYIIIILMIIVAIINILALLLVLIIEKTNMIGILKSFGAEDFTIQKIFISLGSSILIKGIILGNVLALLFIFLQNKFSFLKLDQESYNLSEVPMEFTWDLFLLINVITIAISFLILFLTSLFIARISPVKAIKFN